MFAPTNILKLLARCLTVFLRSQMPISHIAWQEKHGFGINGQDNTRKRQIRTTRAPHQPLPRFQARPHAYTITAHNETQTSGTGTSRPSHQPSTTTRRPRASAYSTPS